MPLNCVDSEVLKKTLPLLIIDGDPEELITALFNVVFDQNDKIVIDRLETPTARMSKLVDIYTRKATSLNSLQNALIEYTAQHHIARMLEENRNIINCQQQQLNDRQVTSFSDLVAKLKECYVDEFSFIKPLSFDELTFQLDCIWINLQLENSANMETSANTDCTECLNVAFGRKKVVICKGEPGTGKSTLSTYLCYKWATGVWSEFNLVFLVPLREVVGKKPTAIIDAVVNVAKSYDMLSDQLENFEKMLRSPSKTLVILDGYDEAIGVCDQLQSVLHNEIKGLPFHILITSRPWAVVDIKCPAQVINILPLTSGQQTEYVKNHFHAIGKADLGDSLILKLKINPVLKALSETALILCYLCFYYATSKTLETSMIDLTSMYLQIIPCLIDRFQTDKLARSSDRVFGENWLQSKIMFNLGKMALYGLNNSMSIFTESDIKRFNIEIDICIGVGLLVRSRKRIPAKTVESTYIYPHFTMQEFDAALFVLNYYSQALPAKDIQMSSPKEVNKLQYGGSQIICHVLSIAAAVDLRNSAAGAITALLELPILLPGDDFLLPDDEFPFSDDDDNFLLPDDVTWRIIKQSESIVPTLVNRITDESVKFRIIDVIHRHVVKRLENTNKSSCPLWLLQLAQPSNLPLFRVQKLPNCYYNSAKKTIYYGDESFNQILPQCRQLPWDSLIQRIDVFFCHGHTYSDLHHLLSHNFVIVDKIINNSGSYLSLCAPETDCSPNDTEHHVGKLTIESDIKKYDEVSLKCLNDTFVQLICSLEKAAKSNIKCVCPVVDKYASWPDINSCIALSHHFSHLSILKIEDVSLIDDHSYPGKAINNFKECWPCFEHVTVVQIYLSSLVFQTDDGPRIGKQLRTSRTFQRFI